MTSRNNKYSRLGYFLRTVKPRLGALVRRTRREIDFALFRLRLDREAASRSITAVILTCDLNPLFGACLKSVENQSLRPFAVEVVSNVTPVSKAEQEGLERVRTKYFVSVDGDMILDRTFLEKLYFLMHLEPNCAQTSIRVRDPFLGEVYAGGRMYKTELARAIGFHPFDGARDHDRYMTAQLKEAGFTTVREKWTGGVHHPVYLPHEVFWKFRVNAEKARYYGDRYPAFRELADHAMDYWRRTRDDTALYALAGLFEGLKTEDAEQELTYEGREDDPAFLKIQSFLDATAREDSPGMRDEGK